MLWICGQLLCVESRGQAQRTCADERLGRSVAAAQACLRIGPASRASVLAISTRAGSRRALASVRVDVAALKINISTLASKSDLRSA
eukprot:6208819-Pleurochrysis_carterae.AAC.2